MKIVPIALVVVVTAFAAGGCGGGGNSVPADTGPVDVPVDPGPDVPEAADDGVVGDLSDIADAADPGIDAPDVADPDTPPIDVPPVDLPKEVPDCVVDEDCAGEGGPLGPCEAVRCVAGGCVHGQAAPDSPCDDGDACTEGDRCQDGACKGDAVECMDGNVCTLDTCDPASGCVHAPASGKCDDGKGCTSFDTCVDGACAGTSRDCDDGDPCTDDACDELAGCTHIENHAICDDLNPCTTGDACNGGTCRGAPVACGQPPAGTCAADGSSRTYYAMPGVCAAGECVYTMVTIPCAAGCADGLCVGVEPCDGTDCGTAPSGCLAAPGKCVDGRCEYEYADGTACDDGDACTTGEVCRTGVCLGLSGLCNDPPDDLCADGQHVTDWSASGVCDPATGACSYESTLKPCPGGCWDGACLDVPGLLEAEMTPFGAIGLEGAKYRMSCMAQPWAVEGWMWSETYRMQAGFEP